MSKQEKKNLKINFFYNISYQILVVVLPLITAPYVSRVLGAENIGIYSYTLSIANYFVLFSMLGVKNYGNRQIAKVRDNKEELSKSFISIYTIQLSVSVALALIYIIYVISFVENNQLISIIQLLFVLTGATDITWFFFGMEEFKTTTLRNFLVKICSLVGIFVFVKEKNDLPIYTFILAGSSLAGFLILFPFVKKYISWETITINDIKKHIVPDLRLFIPVIAVSIFNVMDRIMLGNRSTMVQVGLYENTDKLMRIPFGIITAVGTVMMPHMSHMIAKGDVDESKKLIEQSMVMIMCVACSLAAGLAGVGQVFVPLFFGEEFIECGTLITWMSPTILSLSWANVIRMQYLIPNGMDKEFTISTFIGAIVNVIVNYLLIPRYGALGAVIGTICAEYSLTIYQTYVVRRFLPVRKYLLEILPFLIFGILMSFVVSLVGTVLGGGILTLGLQISIGVIVYILLCCIYLLKSNNVVINNMKEIVNNLIHKMIRKM